MVTDGGGLWTEGRDSYVEVGQLGEAQHQSMQPVPSHH